MKHCPAPMDLMDLRDYFAVNATEDDIKPYLHDWENLRTVIQFDSQLNPMRTKAPSLRSKEEARYIFANAMMKARENV